VAGAWVKPEKKMKSNHDLLMMNLKVKDGGHLRIFAPDLARTLTANDLELVGDGESFRVVQKCPWWSRVEFPCVGCKCTYWHVCWYILEDCNILDAELDVQNLIWCNPCAVKRCKSVVSEMEPGRGPLVLKKKSTHRSRHSTFEHTSFKKREHFLCLM
jgi:hypothetical protein